MRNFKTVPSKNSGSLKAVGIRLFMLINIELNHTENYEFPFLRL